MDFLKRWKINRYTVLFSLVIVIGILDIASDLVVGSVRNDAMIDISKDVCWSFLGLVTILAALQWKEKWGYGLTAFCGLLNVVAPIALFLFFISKISFTTFLYDPRVAHLRLDYAFDCVMILLSIPVVILSSQALLHVLGQEKRVRAMSERELVKEYFKILATHKSVDAAHEPQKARKLSSDFYWDLYEIGRRDRELAKVIKDLSADRNVVSNMAAKKLAQRFGDDLLSPFRYKGK
jgi:hypothetical protein